MSWELTDDLEDFAGTDFLRSRPVEHTVFLTLIDTLRRRGLHTYGPENPVFGRWRTPDGRVGGVLLQTPPFPMMFSALPAEAVPAAVETLAGRPLPGVNLLAGDVDAFVGGWRQRTGAEAVVKMRTRLFRLDGLTPPPAPDGRPRTADAGDRDLLLRWFAAFQDETGDAPLNVGGLVDERLSYGGVTLWEAGGAPVAMAVRSRPQSGMVRIQSVYTPREHRGRGFGGAATAVVTRQALDLGVADVVLFTDLANPTSNGLYQRLGYRPIEDRVVVEFSS